MPPSRGRRGIRSTWLPLALATAAMRGAFAPTVRANPHRRHPRPRAGALSPHLSLRLEKTQWDLGVSDEDLHSMAVEFEAWSTERGRSYANDEARAEAMERWIKNELFIRDMARERGGPRGQVGLAGGGGPGGVPNPDVLDQGRYWVGHNDFSDKTDAELAALLGLPVDRVYANTAPLSIHRPRPAAMLGAPVALDWRDRGAVGPVYNQGQCGSCWAFSAAEAITAAYFIESGQLVPMSMQQLVSCDYGPPFGDQGCNGGLPSNAFGWVKKYGICALKDYKYSSAPGTNAACETTCTPVAKISGYVAVRGKDESALLDALSERPISVAVEADTRQFMMYKGGIFDDSRCGTALDHAVYLVGYGTEAGTPYWTVKNSWGESWGEKGYIRLIRGHNMCGVASLPTYPVGAQQCVNCTAGDTRGGADPDSGGGGGGGSAAIAVPVVMVMVAVALGLGVGLGTDGGC